MQLRNITDAGDHNQPDRRGNIRVRCLQGATIGGTIREVIWLLHTRFHRVDSHGPTIAKVVGQRYTRSATFVMEGVTVTIGLRAEYDDRDEIIAAWRRARANGEKWIRWKA